MVERINVTRDDIALMVGNDQRMIRAFEKLLAVATETNPDNIAGLDLRVDEALILAGKVSPKPQQLPVDYLSFDIDAPHPSDAGTVSWNHDEDTLDINHENGVTQQVGLEQYVRARNDTGATISNGTLVGFTGVSGDIKVSKYIADGSMTAVSFIGVCTQDLNDGMTGKVTTFGKVRGLDTSAWAAGDEIYVSPDTAGDITNVRPTAPKLVISLGFIVVSDATAGEILVRPAFSAVMAFGKFSSAVDITPAAADEAYALVMDTTGDTLSMSLGTPASRIVAGRSGRYGVNVNAQLSSSNASSKDVSFWLRKNGTDVADTRRDVTITGNNEKSSVSLHYEISLAIDEYIEIAWASTGTTVSLSASPATAYSPSASSITINMTQEQL